MDKKRGRPTKKASLPKTIEPANWRELVEEVIKRKFHPGRMDGVDRGLIVPALEMLCRDEMTRVVEYLQLFNKKPFDRFDSDEGNGIDLAGIIQECVVWGKEPRDQWYELDNLDKLYAKKTDPVDRDDLFHETMARAKLLALVKRRNPKELRQAILKAQADVLVTILHRRLWNRFDQNCTDVISLLLNITFRKNIDPRSINKKLLRRTGRPADPRTTLIKESRIRKYERGTGSSYKPPT